MGGVDGEDSELVKFRTGPLFRQDQEQRRSQVTSPQLHYLHLVACSCRFLASLLLLRPQAGFLFGVVGPTFLLLLANPQHVASWTRRSEWLRNPTLGTWFIAK